MQLGFTGTRNGMTAQQIAAVDRFMFDGPFTRAHHGECIGADTDFDRICKANGVTVKAHPPEDVQLWQMSEYADERADPKPYLVRNRDIVDESDHLLATPAEHVEQDKGGTWYTVRYARSQGKSVTVIDPDGNY